jgi:hypothetical protein
MMLKIEMYNARTYIYVTSRKGDAGSVYVLVSSVYLGLPKFPEDVGLSINVTLPAHVSLRPTNTFSV